MDRLLRAFELIDLHTPPPARNDGDTAVLVAQRVSLETWNRFAELDELPRGLQLRQLHEDALGYIQRVFAVALQDFGTNRGQANLTGPDGPLGGIVTFAPDFSYVPHPALPGNRLPRDAVTVIVEVLHSQTWSSVHRKLRMYQLLPHLQYFFFVRMSEQLYRWTYEFYDRDPDFPDPAIQHAFSIRTVPNNHNHIVHFDSRRVLGLLPGAQLPTGCPNQFVLNVVNLARHVLAYAR